MTLVGYGLMCRKWRDIAPVIKQADGDTSITATYIAIYCICCTGLYRQHVSTLSKGHHHGTEVFTKIHKVYESTLLVA
jgi:hypothetical protein